MQHFLPRTEKAAFPAVYVKRVSSQPSFLSLSVEWVLCRGSILHCTMYWILRVFSALSAPSQ